MSTTSFIESVVEDAALAWLGSLGYVILHGPDIAAGQSGAERSDPNYRDVLLERRLPPGLLRFDPGPPPEALEECHPKPTPVGAPALGERKRRGAPVPGHGVSVQD